MGFGGKGGGAGVGAGERAAKSANLRPPPSSRSTPPPRASRSTRRSAPSPPAKQLFSTTATSFSAAAGSAEANPDNKKRSTYCRVAIRKNKKGQTKWLSHSNLKHPPSAQAKYK